MLVRHLQEMQVHFVLFLRSYNMYKLIKNYRTNEINVVNKIEEGRILSIPFDLANTDYQAYLKWLDEGNTPLPADE
jgi:hypothetical protein